MIRAWLAALACAQSCAALAQSDDPAALRREVDELKARVSAIERRLGEPVVATASDPSGWAKVDRGMTQAEIKGLLGEPHKAFDLDGSRVWYYSYRGGAGSVFFDSAGRASSFQRPSGVR
ncbi:MAG TPA: hypothetical protein VFJ70_02575 [Burkholderiales bacterium]|nr:hypothetical protein [Burkholderiales bacterium]